MPSIEDSTSQDSDSSDDGEGVDVSTIVFSSFAYEDVYQVRHPLPLTMTMQSSVPHIMFFCESRLLMRSNMRRPRPQPQRHISSRHSRPPAVPMRCMAMRPRAPRPESALREQLHLGSPPLASVIMRMMAAMRRRAHLPHLPPPGWAAVGSPGRQRGWRIYPHPGGDRCSR